MALRRAPWWLSSPSDCAAPPAPPAGAPGQQPSDATSLYYRALRQADPLMLRSLRLPRQARQQRSCRATAPAYPVDREGSDEDSSSEEEAAREEEYGGGGAALPPGLVQYDTAEHRHLFEAVSGERGGEQGARQLAQ